MGARKQVEVAAGVLLRDDGCFLLGQRAPGTFYPGYWEFPGGKVEAGESPAQALIRELEEELGIRVSRLAPWLVREHVYEHAHVRLHFFEVSEWQGEFTDRVHSALSWQRVEALDVAPMLPANGPILKALSLPRCIGITDCARYGGVTAQLRRIADALEGGLRMVVVRDDTLERNERKKLLAGALSLAAPHGAIVVLNGDVDLAAECGAHGVHLKSRDLMTARKRPDFTWVGASCHDRAQLLRAAELEMDYVLLGTLKATPTHPEQAGLGWAGFQALTSSLPMPVVALGGLSSADMAAARAAGAHGIAGIRGVWGDAG